MDEVVYPNHHIIYDGVKLRYLLMEERDAFVSTYIEHFFDEESHDNQLGMMLRFPFFGNKVLDDYQMSNQEKQEIFLENLTQQDKKEGKLILVDGAKRGGKTGFAMWIIEEYHKIKPDLNYYFVTKKDNKPPLPNWFKYANDVEELPKNTVAIIDEGVINLSARRAMSKENVHATEQLVILAHRAITLIVLVQHIKMIDPNVRRTADIRSLKFGISFGTDDNSKNDDLQLLRTRLKPKSNKEVYIEVISKGIYINFTHPLPPWWNDAISKSWKDFKSGGNINNNQKKKIKSTEDMFE